MCSVEAVLDAIGRELGALAATVEHVQETLSPALSRGLLAATGAIAALQELDRLTQTLHALSAVAARISDAADSRWIIDLQATLAVVPLADLADRLDAGRGPAGERPGSRPFEMRPDDPRR